MAGVWLWVRRQWAAQRAPLVALGLLIALVGGVTLAVTAGARRTASAFGRLETASNAPAVQVELAADNPTDFQHAQTLSPVTLADEITAVPWVTGVTVASFIGATPDPEGSPFALVASASRGAAPRDRLLEGRLPDPDRPDEIVVNEAGAATWHTGVGRKLAIHTLADEQLLTFAGLQSEEPRGPTIAATVVGVMRGIEAISDVPEPIFAGGPSFLERWGDQIAHMTGTALVNVDDAHADAVIDELQHRLGSRFFVSRVVDHDDYASRINDTIDVEVTVLTIFAAVAGLAGLVVVGQALARTAGGHELEQERLRALGVTPTEATLGVVGALVPALLLGVIGAVACAVAVSGVFPRGLARRAEPTPGVMIDTPVIIGGALALLLVLAALAVLASWRATRESSVGAGHATTSTSSPGERLARVLPPVPSLGTLFAFDAGPRRRTIGGLAGIVGAAVLVGGVVGVATVERSRRTLLTTSELYGAHWDYQVDLEDVDADAVLPGLIQDRDVNAVATSSQLRANGGDVQVRGPRSGSIAGLVAYTSLKGSIAPVVSRGRLPGAGEVAIGRRLGRRLGVSIGDSIVVEGYGGDVSLVVTGWFVNPGQDDLDLGMVVTPESLEKLTRHDCTSTSEDFACQIEPQGAAVVLRGGADRAAVESRLTAIAPELTRAGPPSVVDNLAEVGATPWLLAAFLVVIGGSGLAHALIVGVRRHGRDLAVVRALGLRADDARRVVTWQAFVMAVLGAAAGTAIGLLLGRWIWERVAGGIGAVVRVQVPTVALLLAPAMAIALALGLSLFAGRHASVLRPAEALRTE